MPSVAYTANEAVWNAANLKGLYAEIDRKSAAFPALALSNNDAIEATFRVFVRVCTEPA